jgi:hypothetical protein
MAYWVWEKLESVDINSYVKHFGDMPTFDSVNLLYTMSKDDYVNNYVDSIESMKPLIEKFINMLDHDDKIQLNNYVFDKDLKNAKATSCSEYNSECDKILQKYKGDTAKGDTADRLRSLILLYNTPSPGGTRRQKRKHTKKRTQKSAKTHKRKRKHR